MRPIVKMRVYTITLLLLSTVYCHTLYYVHDQWRYTIILEKENSTIHGIYCGDCMEDGWECEELPPDVYDPPKDVGALQPGLITIIALTTILFVLMLLTVTAVITYKYTVRRQHSNRDRLLTSYA